MRGGAAPVRLRRTPPEYFQQEEKEFLTLARQAFPAVQAGAPMTARGEEDVLSRGDAKLASPVPFLLFLSPEILRGEAAHRAGGGRAPCAGQNRL